MPEASHRGSDSERGSPGEATVEDLQAALLTSRLIATAVGVTMHAYRLSSDAALAHLLRVSQARNVKLSVIADDIVDLANRRAALAPDELAVRRTHAGLDQGVGPDEDRAG